MHRSIAGPCRWLAIVGAAVLCALVQPAIATAISAPIQIANTGGEGVFIRAEPNTSSTRLGWMPEGASPDYHCFVWGQVINSVPIWFNVTYNGVTGYYASYYDNSSYHSNAELTAKYGVPLCGQPAPAPPPPAPSPNPTPAPSPPAGSTGGPSSSPPPTTSIGSAAPPPPPCMSRYPSGSRHTRHVFGGTETNYDRQDSLYEVCTGFGAPEGLHLTQSMQCALIAAAATYGGPVVNAGVSLGCNTGSIASGFSSGRWLGAASGVACGYFSTVFATGVGLFAAGATSETGPGAVAVGVNTYRGLAAGLKLVCGGVFDGGLSALGRKLEANHETAIATDVTRHGKCIRLRHLFGQWLWDAHRC